MKIKHLFLFLLLLILASNAGNKCYAQVQGLDKIRSAVVFLDSNRKLLKEEWLSRVVNKQAGYKKILKDGFKYKISDTLTWRSVSYFYSTLLYTKDSLADCDGKRVILGSTVACDKFEMAFSPELSQAVSKAQADIAPDFYIGFSKPAGNYLVCEIWHKRYGERYKIPF